MVYNDLSLVPKMFREDDDDDDHGSGDKVHMMRVAFSFFPSNFFDYQKKERGKIKERNKNKYRTLCWPGLVVDNLLAQLTSFFVWE